MTKQEIYQEEATILQKYLINLDAFSNTEAKLLQQFYQQYLVDLTEAAEELKLDDRVSETGRAVKNLKRKGYAHRKAYLERLGKVIGSPYFARIDLQAISDSQPTAFYIGKLGYRSEDGNYAITDWRTPLASVYYNYAFATPQVQFTVPALTELDTPTINTCNLTIRRTLEIEDCQLINIYDNSFTDNISDTEFLLSRIEHKAGGVLEDIIETIQVDQNEIIRAAPFKNIIVQGVAGSGKTTVAIHRISYLFYNYEKQVLPQKTLFISASKTLINYLARSLPELDVYDIERFSLMDFILQTLSKNNIKIKTKHTFWVPDSELDVYFLDISKFLDYLEAFVADINTKIKQAFDLEVVGERQIHSYNLTRMREKLKNQPVLYMIHQIEDELVELYRELHREQDDYSQRDAYQIKDFIDSLKTFKKQINLEKIYLEFLTQTYGKTPVAFETNHVCALYLLASRLGALKELKNYDLVVVDEAQDFNMLNYHCISTFSSKKCFNLYGDLNQSVIKKYSIASWEPVRQLLQIEHTTQYNLGISFRSTRQIIDLANETLKAAGITENLPIPAYRNGEAPIEKTFTDEKQMLT